MRKKIIIQKSRELVITDIDGTPTDNVVGVVGDKNATILTFEKPTDINGEPIENFTMRAVFNNSFGSHIYDIENDEFVISPNITTDTEILLTIQFLKGSEIKWHSLTQQMFFAPSFDDSGNNILEKCRLIAMRPLNIIINYLNEKFDERSEEI